MNVLPTANESVAQIFASGHSGKRLRASNARALARKSDERAKLALCESQTPSIRECFSAISRSLLSTFLSTHSLSNDDKICDAATPNSESNRLDWPSNVGVDVSLADATRLVSPSPSSSGRQTARHSTRVNNDGSRRALRRRNRRVGDARRRHRLANRLYLFDAKRFFVVDPAANRANAH